MLENGLIWTILSFRHFVLHSSYTVEKQAKTHNYSNYL